MARTKSSSNKFTQEHIIDQMNRYHSDDIAVSQAALVEIMNENAGLIGHIIDKKFRSYKRKYYDDMYSCGKVGLMNAIRMYDPSKGRPSTYFTFFILHEIYTFTNEFIAGVSAHHAANVTKVSTALQRLEEKGIHNPGIEVIAREAGLDVSVAKTAVQLRTAGQTKDYINDEYLEALLTDRNEFETDPSDLVYKNIENQALYEDLSKLSELEQQVLLLKFGFIESQKHADTVVGKKMTHADIAEELNVPVDQIRSLVNSALRKLKHGTELTKYHKDHLEPLRKSLKENDIQCMPNTDEILNIQNNIASSDDEEISGIFELDDAIAN